MIWLDKFQQSIQLSILRTSLQGRYRDGGERTQREYFLSRRVRTCVGSAVRAVRERSVRYSFEMGLVQRYHNIAYRAHLHQYSLPHQSHLLIILEQSGCSILLKYSQHSLLVSKSIMACSLNPMLIYWYIAQPNIQQDNTRKRAHALKWKHLHKWSELHLGPYVIINSVWYNVRTHKWHSWRSRRRCSPRSRSWGQQHSGGAN